MIIIMDKGTPVTYNSFPIWKESNLYCYDLPTTPNPDMGTILVTGATGYIGGRLVSELKARGYQVRVMVRRKSEEQEGLFPDCAIVVADALNMESLNHVLEGIHAAYYLIHSLLLGPEEFHSADILAAENFQKCAEKNDVKRIIYLGGLGDTHYPLSYHLESRMQVAEKLISGNVPVTVLRAAIIIGSGSASYEIIQHLVKNLPIIFTPPRVKNKCQPIGVRDVIKYLVGVLEIPQTSGQYFDIGGRNILTYKKMMEVLAVLFNKKILLIPFPFFHTKIFAYLAGLVTPVPASIIQSLFESLKNDVVCQNDTIQKYLPFDPLSYKETIIKAMTREEQDRVHTRWSDAYPPANELSMKLHELSEEPKFTTFYSIKTSKSPKAIFDSFCKIGGKEGWFHNNWMWRLRGMMDSILMGVGSSRGRRSAATLKTNDVIDFWRVEDLKINQRLLLRAEMKLPGKAWLEFYVDNESGETTLSISAYFETSTIWGTLYWYNFLPFHYFIFNSLLEQVEKKA